MALPPFSSFIPKNLSSDGSSSHSHTNSSNNSLPFSVPPIPEDTNNNEIDNINLSGSVGIMAGGGGGMNARTFAELANINHQQALARRHQQMELDKLLAVVLKTQHKMQRVAEDCYQFVQGNQYGTYNYGGGGGIGVGAMAPAGRQYHYNQQNQQQQYQQYNNIQPSRQKSQPGQPALFKTQMCNNLKTNGYCQFGVDCWFAHHVNELRSVPDTLPRIAAGPPLPSLTSMSVPTMYNPQLPGSSTSAFASSSAGAVPPPPQLFDRLQWLKSSFYSVPNRNTDNNKKGTHQYQNQQK